MTTTFTRRKTALILLLILQLVHVSSFSTTKISTAQRRASAPSQLQQQDKKSAVDEILDALDTMMGVSPLAETDLKSSSPDLEQAQRRREAQSPPEDALQKPSVAIFFALLGLVPAILSIYAVQHGFRPFGL